MTDSIIIFIVVRLMSFISHSKGNKLSEACPTFLSLAKMV